MTTHLKQALINKLTAMADDELILAHRNAEWTGHAPILEEDIALANIAQDELGHATVFYGLLEELTGTTPDQFAMFRDADAFRNAQLLEELERGRHLRPGRVHRVTVATDPRSVERAVATHV